MCQPSIARKSYNEPVKASLQRRRYDIERDFIYNIAGYGRLIEKDAKAQFEKQVEAYKKQLIAHSEGIRKLLDEQTSQILDDAVELIMARQRHSVAVGSKDKVEFKPEQLRKQLQYGLDKAKSETPLVTLVYKDVTYQTQDDEFRKKVHKALPPLFVGNLATGTNISWRLRKMSLGRSRMTEE